MVILSFSICVFASLVGIPAEITSSEVGLTDYAVTAGIKMYIPYQKKEQKAW